MKALQASLGALALAIVFAGCPRPPLDFGPRGRLTDPQVAIDAVRARRAASTRAQGEAKAKIETPDGSGSLTEYVIAEAPARLHLESRSFFGEPLAVLTADGAAFQLLDLERKRFFEGPATPENLARLVQVRVPADELVSLLLGVPPLLDPPDAATLAVDDVAGAYQLSLRKGTDSQEIWLDPSTLRPRAVAFAARGTLSAYRAEFDGYGGDRDLPATVRLASGATKVELTWKDREEPDFDASAFHLEPPLDVERVQVR